MLALALAQGLDPAGYTAADHPVQRFVTQVVADLAGLDPAGILDGTDGCGVPGLSHDRTPGGHALRPAG